LTVSLLSAITAPFQIALGILSQTPFQVEFRASIP
jgi:hypothetical protein